MPTYAYRCGAGHQFEAVQGITEPALTGCTTCGKPVRRVVFPVGIVFKGQGFYKNDSRSSSSSATTAAAPADAKPAAAAAASKPETGSSASSADAPKQDSGSGNAAAKGGTA